MKGRKQRRCERVRTGRGSKKTERGMGVDRDQKLKKIVIKGLGLVQETEIWRQNKGMEKKERKCES